jgi:Cdc6-like AAA superfamily ATPase
MSKTLRVIDSFFVVEVGDTFQLSEDGNSYIFERSEEFRKAGENIDQNATYNASFTISTEYAKQLIQEGYLEEVEEKKQQFVNVFDEINNLINKYQQELMHIDEDMKNEPACMKVEKTTVLSNILGVLNHLKTLRK